MCECNSRYVGETSNHFSTRVNEHLLTDKNSHVQTKHLISSPGCKQKCTPSCFTIIGSAKDAYSVKLKEAIYNSQLKPELNMQLKHNNNFFFFCKQPV